MQKAVQPSYSFDSFILDLAAGSERSTLGLGLNKGIA